MKNNFKVNLQGAALGLGVGVATALAAKYKPVADSFAGIMDKGAVVMKKIRRFRYLERSWFLQL